MVVNPFFRQVFPGILTLAFWPVLQAAEAEFPNHLRGCWVASSVIEYEEQTPEAIGTLVVIADRSMFLLRPSVDNRFSFVVFDDLVTNTEHGKLEASSTQLRSETDDLMGITCTILAIRSEQSKEDFQAILPLKAIRIDMVANTNASRELRGLKSQMKCYRLSCDETARRLEAEMKSVSGRAQASPKLKKWILEFLRIHKTNEVNDLIESP